MKKIIPIASAVCLVAALICAILLKETDWQFSIVFKSMLLAISAFVGLLAYWKGNFKTYILIASIVSFLSLLFILWQSEAFSNWWNIVFAFHIVLIAMTLLVEAKKAVNTRLIKITQGTVIIAMGFFLLLVLGKFKAEWMFQTSVTLLFTMSILLVINRFPFFTKK